MTGDDEVLALVLDAVVELNEGLPVDEQVVASRDTPLLGEGGTLDSIRLVNLVVATEERIEERFDRSIALADDRAFSQARSPFLTIGTLTEYVVERLTESRGS